MLLGEGDEESILRLGFVLADIVVLTKKDFSRVSILDGHTVVRSRFDVNKLVCKQKCSTEPTRFHGTFTKRGYDASPRSVLRS